MERLSWGFVATYMKEKRQRVKGKKTALPQLAMLLVGGALFLVGWSLVPSAEGEAKARGRDG